MDDSQKLTLLRQYEPVLRYVKNERFFPTRIEDFLFFSRLYKTGNPIPKKNPKIEDLANLPQNHYLRFSPESTFRKFLITWALFLITALLIGWWLNQFTGLKVAFWVSIINLIVFYLSFSMVRMRLFSGITLAVFAISGLSLLGKYLLSLEQIHLWLKIIGGAAYVFFAFGVLSAIGRYLVEHVIPEFPGLMMDFLSSATEQVAEESYEQYSKILHTSKPTYYGRVLYKIDLEGDSWTILQYHYFYVFNDWRLAANGINHHEGDWEMAAVYLKNGNPYAVLYSQHHDGAYEKWDQATRMRDKEGKLTDHPLIYAALGSHANYSIPDVIRTPDLFTPGPAQKAIYAVDNFVRNTFELFSLNKDQRTKAVKRIDEQGIRSKAVLSESRVSEDYQQVKDQFAPGLPMELATGDGLRIGVEGHPFAEGMLDSTAFLLKEKSNREVAHPQNTEWNVELIDDDTDWVNYQGLWGVRSLIHPIIADESGPPGPKWDRIKKGEQKPEKRKRWEKPLTWLRDLENKTH